MRPRPITGRGRFLFRMLRNKKTIDVHLAERKIVALQHRSGTQNSQANSDIISNANEETAGFRVSAYERYRQY